jgi:predicted DNA-binding transcriptional regulator AlpA
VTKIASISINDARALAEQWETERKEHLRSAAVANRFRDATPAEVVWMYESARNERGQKLSQAEFAALVERWLGLFGAYPPSEAEAPALPGEEAGAANTEPDPQDDDMLSARDVARLTGVSLRTIKRMVGDGRFPKPIHLPPRRIGWQAHEVKAWIKGLDDQRHATRQ